MDGWLEAWQAKAVTPAHSQTISFRKQLILQHGWLWLDAYNGKALTPAHSQI
jgi:hypothetical protein